jgi:hypothetical protein
MMKRVRNESKRGTTRGARVPRPLAHLHLHLRLRHPPLPLHILHITVRLASHATGVAFGILGYSDDGSARGVLYPTRLYLNSHSLSFILTPVVTAIRRGRVCTSPSFSALTAFSSRNDLSQDSWIERTAASSTPSRSSARSVA